MISSIVLAAGMSSRMGRPKALLDWGGEPLVNYQVKQLIEAGVDEVVVVLGYRADDISREMRPVPCRTMLNARYQMGRAGSLRIGAKAVNRDADTIVIVNVDQPCPAEVSRQLIDAHQSDEWLATRPVFDDGHGGHPVVVSGRLRGELMEAKDETGGLRGVLQNHPDEVQSVPGDERCRVDLDTPEDYERARPRAASV
jgi:molybdenum cofactor cytidylyltransferase